MASPKARGTVAIPSWQRDVAQAPLLDPQASSEETHSPAQEDRNESAPDTPDSSTIKKEHVEKFLLDPSVKDAPWDKKRAFLISKGVPLDMINDALSEPSTVAEPTRETVTFDIADFRSSQTSSSSTAPSRDTPPIVTYPEFLVKPQRPPPLVTINGLLNTAYVAGGLATLFYGTSKYLVEPMLAHLAQSRHDFATHSIEQVNTLNSKLERVVSKVPAMPTPAASTIAGGDDDESVTSDPTELFHRDIGVQTSPSLSRRGSFTSIPSPAPTVSVLDQQHDKVSSLRDRLDEALNREGAARDTNSDLDASVNDLRDYLNGLVYSPPTHADYGVWNPNEPAGRRGGKGGQEDAVMALRNEIRSVKGVMLSARQFPAMSPAR